MSFKRALLSAALLASACTLQEQAPPPVSGPSEFGTSITVSISPDVLSQDGGSQSVVTITARDGSGQPVRNLSLRAEIRVNGVPADFGMLSARNLVTGADGRATLVYTAPSAPSVTADTFTLVDIVVTPIGTDFQNTAPRVATVRLVPPGVVIPPSGLLPRFLVTPGSPAVGESAFFDASQSLGAVDFEWRFGDGDTGDGQVTTHAYDAPGTYVVTLTIFDEFGRSASVQGSVTVIADPTTVTTSFTFSPVAPLPGQQVNFNASEVQLSSGRRITRYTWDFGDGTAQATGIRVSHTYPVAGTYTVTLAVRDDQGRTFFTSQQVAVEIPDVDDGTFKGVKR